MSKVKALMDAFVANKDGGIIADYPEVENWKKSYRKIANAVKKDLESVGFTKVKLTRGHFSISGFATAPCGKIIYISLDADFDPDSVLIRVAKSYTDYRGECNNFSNTVNIAKAAKQIANCED